MSGRILDAAETAHHEQVGDAVLAVGEQNDVRRRLTEAEADTTLVHIGADEAVEHTLLVPSAAAIEIDQFPRGEGAPAALRLEKRYQTPRRLFRFGHAEG